jgi:hypothetical protein
MSLPRRKRSFFRKGKLGCQILSGYIKELTCCFLVSTFFQHRESVTTQFFFLFIVKNEQLYCRWCRFHFKFFTYMIYSYSVDYHRFSWSPHCSLLCLPVVLWGLWRLRYNQRYLNSSYISNKLRHLRFLCYFMFSLRMVGFEPAYAPHFGSGYDTYIYGSYFGHPVSLSDVWFVQPNTYLSVSYNVILFRDLTTLMANHTTIMKAEVTIRAIIKRRMLTPILTDTEFMNRNKSRCFLISIIQIEL